MRPLLVSLAVAGMAMGALAADPPQLPVAAPVPGAADAPAKAPDFPSGGAPASSVQTMPPPAPLPQPVKAELNDGSKVEFDADGKVWVVDASGSRTIAPDGILSLKDGTPFAVKNGKRVDNE